MYDLASSESGSYGLVSTLYLPAEISVVLMPSCSYKPLRSSCADHTPIEPTFPDGETTISSAADASQYAADAANVFATATIGFCPRAARISFANSGISDASPPGESMSN